MKKHAFVIQAVGQENSDTRTRADRVLASIIKPACDATGYEAVRADQLMAKTIAEPIISALNTHPLAIADLGAPPWNPNVLTEIGFRLATGRPIVFLADADPKSDIMPLHLRNVRIRQINSAEPAPADVEALVGFITEHGSTVQSWESDYPVIEFSLKRNTEGRFIYANQPAADIYGVANPDDLLEKSVVQADLDLFSFIHEDFREDFRRNQTELDGTVWQRYRQGPPTATVPLLFDKHKNPRLNKRFFWPVLVQHRFDSDDPQTIIMRVMYIEITPWIARDHISHPRSEGFFIPALFRDPGYPYDLFLSYNSRDKDYVSELHLALTALGLKVWYDRSDLVGTGSVAKDLKRQIARSRVFAMVLGANGLGRWQSDQELQHFVVTQLNKPFILLLLPDVGDGDSWKLYVPEEYQATLFDRLYCKLPPQENLRAGEMQTQRQNLVERLLEFFVKAIRGSDD
jgi:hypothetical protein